MSKPSDLLTVEEVAVSLHETVSSSAVRTLIHQGKIAAIRIGKRYYMTRKEYERFLSECLENGNSQDFSSEKTTVRGSSSMVEGRSGQAMLMDFISKQKKS